VPFQVIPREQAFFDLLDRAADGVVTGARELAAMVADLGAAEGRSQRIQEIEHAGDELTHQAIALLNTTFVTPMDRQDIHRLATWLDDVLDAQEAVSDLLVLHRIREPISELGLQADILVRASEAIAAGIRGLRWMSDPELSRREITRLEREGDRVYRRGVARLFSGDHKAMEVLKWKDILEQMEAAIDRCEDIADVIESILVKQA